MKLTKYIHSCVLLEEKGEQLLIDPGVFTFSQGVSIETFTGVSTIIITHSHPDHMDAEHIKEIAEAGTITIISNDEVIQALKEKGVSATFVTTTEDEPFFQTPNFSIEGISATHEGILADVLPTNFGYYINNKLLVPGDSFAESLSRLDGIDTLFLPISAPWATELDVYAYGAAVAPKRIVPAHDGYMKDFFLKTRYENYTKYFSLHGIAFESIEQNGGSLEI